MEILTKYFGDLSEKQSEQYAALQELYEEWNQKINVISRKDMENFYEHHVLHSLAIAALFNFTDGDEIMDLGCGGGFPGIPLAIFFPNVHFHLVDSIQKKLKVVEAIAGAIELKNISVQHVRAEQIDDKKFDVIVSRSVAQLKDLWRWSKPLLKKRSEKNNAKISGLLCFKGGDIEKEISESGLRPKIWEISKIFEEDYFVGKYLLQCR